MRNVSEKSCRENQNIHFIFNNCSSVPKHAGPEAKGSSPTAGRTLLWDRNPFRGNLNHWQVSWNEAGQILCERRRNHGRPSGYVRPERVNKWPNSMTDVMMMMMMMFFENRAV
jgi:hypothetical protein